MRQIETPYLSPYGYPNMFLVDKKASITKKAKKKAIKKWRGSRMGARDDDNDDDDDDDDDEDQISDHRGVRRWRRTKTRKRI